MEWDSTLVAMVVTDTILVLGGLLGMWWRMSNIATRVETCERDMVKVHERVDKRDAEHSCLDTKVDDIKVELAKIETKLDILVHDRQKEG